MASSLAWTLPALWPVAPTSNDQPLMTADEPVGQALERGPLTELDERRLVEACLDGRPGAFDLIVERHRRPMYQLCYRFVANHEDANDLTQDIFLRAFR